MVDGHCVVRTVPTADASMRKWDMTPSKIKQGQWCPKCSMKKRGDLYRDTIENMKKIAQERGGKCLSKAYDTAHTKLSWKCSRGHKWEATPSNIKRDRWCPKCGRIQAAETMRRNNA